MDLSKYKNSLKKDGKTNWQYIIVLFILVVCIVFVIYYILKGIVNQFQETSINEPYLFVGSKEETTKMANNLASFPGKNIPLSNDGQYGIEFSYSTWVFIDNLNTPNYQTDGEKLYHILHKGDAYVRNNPIQCPGIWLKRNENEINLVVKLNTFINTDNDCAGKECILERCDIDNIPMKKWFHVTLVVINKNVDIYINGFLKKRCLLKGLPKQNIGNVYINNYGGFDGFLSKIRYFNYSLPVWKIEKLVNEGPSTYLPSSVSDVNPPYLSYKWWVNNYDTL